MKACTILRTCLIASLSITSCSNDKYCIAVGNYGGSAYIYTLDPAALSFTLKHRADATNASYALAWDNGEIEMLAVSETGNGSGVYSFNFQADSEIPKSYTEKRQTADDPCFLMRYNISGNEGSGYILTADYSGGAVSVFPYMDRELKDRCFQLVFSGCGPDTLRQESSHIHQLKSLPGHPDTILATDLGADKIHILKALSDEKCGLVLEEAGNIDCPEGSGPRHMEFSSDGKMLYCITELSGEVLVYNTDGFKLIQRVKADEADARGSADIHIHPSGKFLYTSHRLENDGISVFNIAPDGTIEKTAYARTGRHPRNFMITDDGRLLLVACRDELAIEVYRISNDGTLTNSGSSLVFDSDRPSSVTAVKMR
ncbi:MAG: beta-propeller fold lactonase family protein [Candidatus Cryptobacteroides sp.]